MSRNDSNGYMRYLARRDYPEIQPNALLDIEEEHHDSDKSSLIDEGDSDENVQDSMQYDSDWS